jgi:glycosyltransferase involved in cell wall biosynthesis
VKGDNIIEAYCALCGKPITAADINLGYQVILEGKPTHLHHDLAVIKGLDNPNILKGVIEIVQYMIDNADSLTPKNLYQIIVDKALPLGIEWEELKRYLDGALCRTKYRDGGKSSELNA